MVSGEWFLLEARVFRDDTKMSDITRDTFYFTLLYFHSTLLYFTLLYFTLGFASQKKG